MDRELIEIIRQIENPDELEQFFVEILTPNEVRDLTLRWRLMKALYNGMTQRKISETMGISLCKITRGSKVLKKQNSIILKMLNKTQHFDNIAADD